MAVQRTAGVKRVVGVAVGEKHSLVLLRARTPPEAKQHTSGR